MTTFSKLVRPDEVPATGLEWRVEADGTNRAAIARRLGIPAIESLAGALVLKRIGRGFELQGHIDAVLERLCVSSLERLQEILSEDFTIAFSPDADGAEGGGAAEVEIDAGAPEPIPDDGFDLVEILVQQLALAMDPYPHASGARPLSEEHGKIALASPFEALKGAFAARRDKE